MGNSKKKHKREKSQNRKMILFGAAAGGVAAILAAVTIIVFNKDNSKPEKALSKSETTSSSVTTSAVKIKDPIVGTWEYADGTKYRFGENGKGAMIVEKYEYVYSYTADGTNLFIDYEKPEVHDANYTYSVKDTVLHMVGGEGTAGGEYDMKRVG